MDDAKANLWHDLASLDELKAKGRLVVKAAGKQLALFATPDGFFACNNRCPHEGYPLSEGTLDGQCRLTCNWHNWKFDLKTGANAYGGDALRIYPVKEEAGRIFVKIEDPPPEALRKEALRRLGEAIDDRDYDRMARELARHARAGGEAGDAIAFALMHKNENFEFGFGHAQAGAADWLWLHDEAARDESEKLAALTEICDHLADDSLREPAYPFAQRVERWSQVAFLAAVEAEDEPAAQAILNGALTTGLGFADLEETLSKSALSHYADFGHSIIYVTAAGRLIERLGKTVEAPLLKSLVRQQVMARREDLIPEFRAYAGALKRFGESKGSEVPDVSGANVPKALELLAQAGGAKPEALFDHLLAVNADRLLRFDLELGEQVGASVADSVNWLDVTHGLTFATAVLKTCRKFPSLWPQGLLQMACFSGRNLPFAKKSLNQADWAVADWPAFLAEQRAALFDHGLFRPIIAVHRLKTLEAANFLISEKPASAALIAAALRRYLASTMKGKHALRIARQSLSFVAKEG